MIIHKERPCHPDNYKKGRGGGVKYLVVHYVGATGDAGDNARYYGTTKGLKASAHYFVGHAPSPEVWESVAEQHTAWHCGGKQYIHPDCRNDNAIGVEICCHKTAAGEWYFDQETVDVAVELCRDIVGRHNIPPERVLRHYDVTGKICPAPFVKDQGAWENFKWRIFEEVSGVKKCMAKVKLEHVERVAIIFGNGQTMAQVKADVGCDYIINGGLYDKTGPVCHLKVDGVTKAKDPWSYVGYGWDRGPDIRDIIVPMDSGEVGNAIACVWLLGRGIGPGDKLLYDKALGGTRGRSAIALTEDSLILYCTKDGSGCAVTPEELQVELAKMGATSALMLDSGGSSQCDFGEGQTITSSRKVNNYICVWTRKKDEEPVGKYKVTTNKDPLTVRKQPDGTKVGSYPKGTVVEVLEVKDGWARTALGWCSMNYLELVQEAQDQPVTPPATVNDPDEPAGWAQEAWGKAKTAGVLDGTRPTEAITRQEVAVILDRLGLLDGGHV